MQIDILLQTAEQYNQQVHTDVSFKRPDRAYIESLKCAEILRLIAHHREFPYLNTDRKSRHIKIRKVSLSAIQESYLSDSSNRCRNMKLNALCLKRLGV